MNEELKKAYEGIEVDLELVEYEGFYNHIKEWNFIKNYITNLQQENTRLKEKIEKAIEKIKNIDKYEETLNDDTRVYMVQDVDVDEIERILKEN